MGNIFLLVILISAKLTDGFEGSTSLPKITEHPSDITVLKNNPATLNCQAQGRPPPKIHWFKDGKLVRTSPGDPKSQRVLLPIGSLFFLRVIQTRKEDDSGIYWCQATNERGSVNSTLATLEIAVIREEFRAVPSDTVVATGESALLQCIPPIGNPEPMVGWRRNGQVLNIGYSDRFHIVDDGSLLIDDARQSDSGEYVCEAWSIGGSKTTLPVQLDVHIKPSFIRAPQDSVTLSESTVEFECQVSGDPTPQVTWKRMRGPLPKHRMKILDDHTLRIAGVSLVDQDTYICQAVNIVGVATANVSLVVHTAPVFVVRPRDTEAPLGAPVAFECVVKGLPPPLVVWSKQDGHELFLPRQDTPSGSLEDNPNVWVNADGTLVINNVTREAIGWYSCAAVSAAGSLLSRALLDVPQSDRKLPPLPTESPPPVISVRPGNLTVALTSAVLLECQVNGDPKPLVSWRRNGNVLQGTRRRTLLKSGTLQINDVRSEDEGEYTCMAQSKSGTSVAKFFVGVVPEDRLPSSWARPDPRDLPGPPQNIVQLAGNETSITVGWSPPLREGASAITSYTIEVWGGQWTSWKPIVEHIPAESYCLTDLQPNTQYRIVARALNMHGKSPASEIPPPLVTESFVKTVDTRQKARFRSFLTQSLVKLLRPVAVSSTSIRVSWKIHDHKIYVDGIHIRFRKWNEKSFHLRILPKKQTPSYSFLLSGLEKYTNYEIFVLPFYQDIHGHPSNSMMISTLEDVPSMGPEGLNLSVVTANEAKLTWQNPDETAINGVLTKFSIFLVENHTTPVLNFTTPANIRNATLSNLTFGVTYSVTVAANTRIGAGPSSLTLSWLQNPATFSMIGNGGYPRRIKSPFFDFVLEAWFISAIGAAAFVTLFVLIAVLYCRRRTNDKRVAANGYKVETTMGPNGTAISSGLWIDQGKWNANGHPSREKCATPEKLLNVNTAADYSRVDYPIPTDYLSQVSVPVAYATTNIYPGKKTDHNIPVYSSLYDDNENTTEDNVVMYCTLKKPRISNAVTASPKMSPSQNYNKGLSSVWDNYAPPLPDNPPPDKMLKNVIPYNGWGYHSPVVARALDKKQNYATGSLPRGQKLNNGSMQTRNFNTNACNQYPPPPYPTSVSQPRRDAKGILPQAEIISSKNVSPVSAGLQGLQGLSGSIGTPGIHRRNLDSASHFPDMYGTSCYGSNYDDSYYKCPEKWSVYEPSAYRSNSPHAVGIPHSPTSISGRMVNASNQGAKIHEGDRPNTLLNEESTSPLAR